MTSEKLAFGAVGGVSNCAHPIFAAKSLSLRYEQEGDDWQLIPPAVLIGAGADVYCAEIFPTIGIVKNDQLCSKLAKIQYKKALKTLGKYKSQHIERLDTVGGVSIMVNV